MSAATDNAEIDSALSGISYTEMDGEKPIGQRSVKQRDKTYELTYGEPDIKELSSNTTITSDLIILDIAYRKDKDRDHPDNMDLLRTVYDTLKALTNFKGLEAMELIKDEDTESGYNDIGHLEFFYNTRSC